jgi:hypothetical protein
MNSIVLLSNTPFTTNNIRSSKNPTCVASSFFNLLGVQKKPKIIVGHTHALFLLGSQSSGDLMVMFVASFNNFLAK